MIKLQIIGNLGKDCILKEIKYPHEPKTLILPVTVLESTPIVKYEAGILSLEFSKIVKASKSIPIN
jgi:HSP20 family molecular chaperone IbpA